MTELVAKQEFGGGLPMAIQMRVKTSVGVDRQVTFRLPPEVPAGEVEMEVSVEMPDEPIAVILPAKQHSNTFRSGVIREVQSLKRS